ncbi:MarR family transcriptional regulator [Zhihengliuella sp.]|uniref:MarR family winged helix-turn-helix transcriptional regulator n=1 Tax=Zhihengliuella sp. TaxID=1954483 RepID=UPI002810E17C|nr:MarR family transcriptional regulator [Zhihengliuella sp.]
MRPSNPHVNPEPEARGAVSGAPLDRPDSAGLRWRLIESLQRVTVASERYVDSAARSARVHKTDLHALNAVLESERSGEAATASDLARHLGLSAPATTALVDRLQKQGHVERRRDAADRRRIELHTTDLARRTGSRIFRPLALALDSMAGAYTDDELRLIEGFLHRASTTIDEAADGAARRAAEED